MKHANVSLETEFVVTTKTGSVNGAGTDAKVFVTFNGDKKQIAKHQLKKPEGGKNPFEKDSKDVFKFNEVDIGKVRLINPCYYVYRKPFYVFSSKRSLWSTMDRALGPVGTSIMWK